MIIDTHVHYDDKAFDDDREELLQSLKDHDIGAVIDCGDRYVGLSRILEMTDMYPFLYGAVGVHPASTGELDDNKLSDMKEMCGHGKIVAVGEIGLDYHDADADRTVQKEWFVRQFRLASESGLPVIIHSRDAAADTMDIVRKQIGTVPGGVMHCYSYSPDQAEEYVSMGLLIGVGGVVTFKNARKLKETVSQIPLSSILLETDCPYLAPEPFRGRRNSSLYLPYVIQEIANLRNISTDEVIRATEENAVRLFHIGHQNKQQRSI